MTTFKVRLDLAVLQGAALALGGCGAKELPALDSQVTADAGGKASTPDSQPTAGTGGKASTPDSQLTAGTGGKPLSPDSQPTAGTGGEASSPDSQLTAGAGGEPSQPDPPALRPYPVEDVGCTGKEYDDDLAFGFHGQCCTNAVCETPEDGVCKPSPNVVLGAFGSVVGLGLGGCLCGETTGPFAPNPAHTPTREGSCCYLIPSIGCDGRAFMIDGQPLVAAPLARVDWLASELRGALAA